MEKDFDPLELLLKDSKAKIPYDAGFNNGYKEGLLEGQKFRQEEINKFLQALDVRIEKIIIDKIPVGIGRKKQLPATIANEWYRNGFQDVRKMLKKHISFIPLGDVLDNN